MFAENIVKTLKQYDTGDAIRVQLINTSNGNAVDIAGATITFKMYLIHDDDNTKEEVVSAAATIESTSEGKFAYIWTDGDTDTVGTHLALFNIVFSDASQKKFPKDGYIEFRIQDALGDA